MIGATAGRPKNRTGYSVDGPTAMASLAVTAPDAAAWWHRNADRAFDPGSVLVFAGDCCDVCG